MKNTRRQSPTESFTNYKNAMFSGANTRRIHEYEYIVAFDVLKFEVFFDKEISNSVVNGKSLLLSKLGHVSTCVW